MAGRGFRLPADGGQSFDAGAGTGYTARMHILHLGKYYAPYRGGMETILQAMAEGLLDEGCDVTLVVSAEGPRNLVETVRGPGSGREGRLLRVARLGLVNSQPINPSLAGDLRREMARRRPDILHVHLPNPLAAATCLALRRDPSLARVPLAVWYHADITRQRLGARLVAPVVTACLREADGICVSSAALRDGSPVLAPWRDKVSVVPFGIEALPWRDVVPRRDGPLLFVGRLVGYKGVAVLLEALARVPGAHLDIVGEGPLEAELRGLASRLGLESYGIEVNPELVHQARQLAIRFGAQPTFAVGSFIPDDFHANVRQGDEFYRTETNDLDAYGEFKMDLGDFDLIYAYPWPEEHAVFRSIVRRCAAPHALYLRYDAREGLSLTRPAANRLRRNNLQ